MARGICNADRGHQPMRSNDFTDDDGLVQIPAGRGQQHRVARGQTGFVEPVAEPARRGGADGAADGERGPAVA